MLPLHSEEILACLQIFFLQLLHGEEISAKRGFLLHFPTAPDDVTRYLRTGQNNVLRFIRWVLPFVDLSQWPYY